MKDTRREFGYQAESRIKEFYLQNGYELIAENFEYRLDHQTGRKGEIDLIMLKPAQNLLAFVEVKARNNTRFGSALEQVTNKQLRSIYFAIQFFLKKNRKFYSFRKRFDLAVLENSKIQIIPNAYSFDEF
jgi:putative endonuclease